MINLLSTEKKAEIRAARTNTILVRYIIVLTLALGFIVGAFLVSKQSLETSQASAVAQLGSEGLSPEDITTITAEAVNKELSSFKASTFLVRLSASLPAGTITDAVNLQQDTLSGTPATLTFYSVANTEPELLSQALEGSSLFTDLTLQSTNRNSKDISGHPVKFTYTATINPTQSRTSR